MGAWGYGSFENDDALDWVFGLQESGDHSVIDQSLSTILDASGGYLESPDCCEALAAAETVAALLGKPVVGIPEEVGDWVQGKPEPTEAIITHALAAVDSILNQSELKELWEDAGDLDAWEATVRDLQARLR